MSNAAHTPGQRYIERRPCTAGEKLFLVEIGAKTFPRDVPADMIELITLGECDESGCIIREFDIGPISHRIAPGVVDGPEFTPARFAAPKQEAA